MPIEDELRSAWERDGHERVPPLDLSAVHRRARVRRTQRTVALGTGVAASVAGVALVVQLVAGGASGPDPAPPAGPEPTRSASPSPDPTIDPTSAPGTDPTQVPTAPDGDEDPEHEATAGAEAIAESIGMQVEDAAATDDQGARITMTDGAGTTVEYTVDPDVPHLPTEVVDGSHGYTKEEVGGVEAWSKHDHHTLTVTARAETGVAVRLVVTHGGGQEAADRANDIADVVLALLLGSDPA